MKFWILINASRIVTPYDGYSTSKIKPDGFIDFKPKTKKPVYFDREKAEDDLLMKKEKYPDRKWVLLESVAVCQEVEGRGGAFRLEDMENFVI